MAILVQCAGLPLQEEEVKDLWKLVREKVALADIDVVIRCVGEDEIKQLNVKYRGKTSATNILTFVYGRCVDIALCGSIARREARSLSVELRDYTALLLVHGLLHAAGLDHERSDEDEKLMFELQADIVIAAGFSVTKL